jgi:hypothetical protein
MIPGSLAVAGMMCLLPRGSLRDFALALSLLNTLAFSVLLAVNIKYGKNGA